MPIGPPGIANLFVALLLNSTPARIKNLNVQVQKHNYKLEWPNLYV